MLIYFQEKKNRIVKQKNILYLQKYIPMILHTAIYLYKCMSDGGSYFLRVMCRGEKQKDKESKEYIRVTRNAVRCIAYKIQTSFFEDTGDSCTPRFFIM